MQSYTYEEYRKELNKYKETIIYAIIRKNFENDQQPIFSLDIDVVFLPKSDEEIEKKVTSQLLKSEELAKVLELYEMIGKII